MCINIIREAHRHSKLELADAIINTPRGGSLRVMGTCGTTYRKVTEGDRFAAKEKLSLRYQEECTTRENPIRIGTKRIRIGGVEYPFVAVSDHWRPALLHDNRMVWIHHYRAIEGLRRAVFKVYYAVGKVPYNRLPWTLDNRAIETGGRHNDGKFEYLLEAVNAALVIAQEKDIEMQRSSAASLLGRCGGMATGGVKAEKSRENGAKGGRKKQFSALDVEEGD